MEKKTFTRLGIGLVAMAVATLAGQYLIMLVIQLAFPSLLQYDGLSYLLTMAFYLCGTPVFWLMIRRLPVSRPAEKKPVTFGSTVVLFLVSYGVMSVFNMFGAAVISVLNLVRGVPINDGISSLLQNPNYLWIFLTVCIFSPVVEELLFRKLLLDRLRPFGDLAAVLYSGIAFGLFHMDLHQMFYAVPLGIVFAYITLRTGSIRQTVLLHIIVNSFGSLVSPFLRDKLGSAGLMIYLGFMLATVVFAIVWLAANRRRFYLERAQFSFSQPVTARLICLNPGTILSAVFSIGMIFFNAFYIY